MRIHIARGLRFVAPLVIIALVTLACGGTPTVTVGGGTPGTGTPGTGTPGSGTATATHTGPTATPKPAPPHAFAWVQFDSSHISQIWASINGGTPAQITHLTVNAQGCIPSNWGLPVFSPDLTHIASVIGYICGDGPPHGPVQIINASNGSMTQVPGTSTDVNALERQYGWVNNSTIYVGNYGGLYEYTLGAGSAVHMAGAPANVEEAVLRGSTLFYSTETSAAQTTTGTLYRYDLNSHSVLGGAINLGTIHGCYCSASDIYYQGWDVSPDGSHVVYQVTTGNPSVEFGIASSHIYYANADGSGASQIASYMLTSTLVRMQIAPSGALVAIAHALPSPSVITASVTSSGNSGDPNFHAYAPDALAFPVWKWDSSQFWAATAEATAGTSSTGTLENYAVGAGSGSVGVAGGFNPWYTIGG